MASLRKNLVEPNHPNCELIEIAVQDCLLVARKIFGNRALDKLSEVRIEFFGAGRDAALATIGQHVETGKTVGLIQFSMYNVIRRKVAMVKQIVPHELAHVICMANGWDYGHGRIWKQVCMMLGGNGETHNTFAVVDGRLKNLYEARTEDGSECWLTGPQRRVAASSGIVVVDAGGKQHTLTKRSLTGNIKPI